MSDDGMDSPTPVTNGNDDLPTGSGSKYQQKKAKKQAKKQSKVTFYAMCLHHVPFRVIHL